MSKSPNIQKQKLLLVEGKDEEQLFAHVLERVIGTDAVQVIHTGGRLKLHQLIARLKDDRGLPDVSHMVLMQDAEYLLPDDAPEPSTVQRTRDRIRYAFGILGIDAGQLEPGSTSMATRSNSSPVRIGCWIFPDNKADGYLEHLCLQALPDTWRGCIDSYLACLQGKGLRNLHPRVDGKAQAYSWIAGTHEPDRRMGTVASEMDWSHPAFRDLLNFLRLALDLA